ncbi:MAG: type II/IV secretion system ATPase subunit [Euryarchaeota archaeon]|nr:type II/IV secretion system ATPase subunit [Euryarchaeota archaeon]
MGLLEKAQMKKNTETHPQVAEVIFEETVQPMPQSLLEKARLKKQSSTTVSSERALPKGEGITVVEEHKGYGWNKLGTKRLVFDHSTNDYRYEVIEPVLNKKEQILKNEISHLFKMLADIDTYSMTKTEKEKFLVETLDQIIRDNSIKFAETKKLSRFSQPKKTKQKKPKKPKKTKSTSSLKNNEKQLEAEEPDTSTLDAESKDKIFYHIFRDFLGYGRIDILIQDDGIEDVSCDGPDTPIFIHHRKYEAIETNIFFENETELNSFVVRLCQISGKQISIYAPIVDGKLPDGSRLQATLARTVTLGSTFTLRKFREDPITPIDLIGYKSMSLDMAAYFWMAIEHGSSILFCGGTASGKTSALNALSLFIPASHKIISIEDTREVSLPHKNWIAGTTRTGFAASDEHKTGKDIDMFDLIRAALRQRPRVIIVGEVRGREAYSLFQAMATGHTSYATVHASTIHTLIQRLENPPISLPRALLTSLEVIVFQNAVEIGGKMVRRMISVTEIIKLDSDTNQLIFMAPFTWVSKTDDRFECSKASKVLNMIRLQNDWTEEQLNQELDDRKTVLEWMLVKNIRSYKEVGRIVSQYKKFPDLYLKKAKEELGR